MVFVLYLRNKLENIMLIQIIFFLETMDSIKRNTLVVFEISRDQGTYRVE